MTVSMCTVSSVSAYDTNTLYSQAQTQQQNSDDSVYGDFQYTVSDGKVTITNYTGRPILKPYKQNTIVKPILRTQLYNDCEVQ